MLDILTMNYAANIGDAGRRKAVEACLARCEVVEVSGDWLTLAERKDGYHHAMIYPVRDGVVDWAREGYFVGRGDDAASAIADAFESADNWPLESLGVNTPVRVLPPDKWAGNIGVIAHAMADDAPQRVLGKRYCVSLYDGDNLIGQAYYRQSELELLGVGDSAGVINESEASDGKMLD